jgi:hypothetical protein
VERVLLALLAVFLASPVLAATARETSVEALARDSGAVVRARVMRQTSRWTGDRRRILTDLEVEVLERWRGTSPGRLVVTVPGGRLDGVGQLVDGAPAFGDGDDVVLFLVQRGREWRLVGLGLGAFQVAGEQAAPGTTRFRFLPGHVPPGEARIGPMPLAQLRWLVESTR